MKWRTHVFINGPKNTGKSTLIKGMTDLLDPMAVALDGTSSEAGIRQSIGADSRPVILDEFESDGSIGRMRQVLKLARSASTGGAPIARGTPEGKALQFQVHSSFCFGAIIPINGTAADRSRIVELEIMPHDSDRSVKQMIDAGLEYVATHRSSWTAKMADLIEVIEDSVGVFRSEMGAGDIRHTENMANLLGAAYAALHGQTPKPEQAQTWLTEHDSLIARLAKSHDEDDSVECLNHLLQYVCHETTIHEMLVGSMEATGGPVAIGDDGPSVKLPMFGLKVVDGGVLVANTHRELNRIFSGTIWAEGGWATSLRRLPRAEVGDQHRTRFSGGQPVRCVFLPMSLVGTLQE
jgi:hypothetical protein